MNVERKSDEIVRALYRGLLERQPRDEEIAGWVAGLEHGMLLEDVIREFAGSEERARLEQHRTGVRAAPSLDAPPPTKSGRMPGEDARRLSQSARRRATGLSCVADSPPSVPPVGSLPLSKVCELEDFRRPDFQAWAHAVFPHEVIRFGPRFPESVEYRKHWEVVMAARGLASGGALSREAEVLGVGAGNEPTLFWLTQHVRRVFATDLYATPGWEESAMASMLVDPSRHWPSPWDPRRLVVQHMDARELCYVDGTFDGAFSCSSIEHFGNHDDVRQACDELCRVVRPGGVVALSTELRLAGEGDRLPGTLLFSPQQLTEIVIDGRPWELLQPAQFSPSPATLATAGPLDDASADVRAHVEKHGEIRFHELDWSRYPQIVLAHGDYLFTSVHLTLRRSGGASRSAR